MFTRDDNGKAYQAYKNFAIFKKSEQMAMFDYIIEFDQRYSKSKKYKMTLPEEAMLAFKLQDNAGLSGQEKQLPLAASANLDYKSMKSALQRIFGNTPCAGNSLDMHGVTVKQEPVYYIQHKKGTNPINTFSKKTKCAIGESVYHWTMGCSEKSASVKLVEDK